MQGIFQKENTDKALKYGIYRHLPTYEKIIRNLVSFSFIKSVFHNWHEHNYQDYPHIPSQASVLALPFPENN